MHEKHSVGKTIRQLRESRNLSIDQLAELSQTHKKFIEQLETEHLVPSIAPLLKIAHGLGVQMSTFLDDDPVASPIIARAGQPQTAVEFSGLGPECVGTLEFHPLAKNKKDRHMEPFIVDVHPSVPEECTFSYHEGEEFMYVLAGQIEVLYAGERYLLNVGDSIYYESNTPHQVQAAGDKDARILAVIYA